MRWPPPVGRSGEDGQAREAAAQDGTPGKALTISEELGDRPRMGLTYITLREQDTPLTTGSERITEVVTAELTRG